MGKKGRGLDAHAPAEGGVSLKIEREGVVRAAGRRVRGIVEGSSKPRGIAGVDGEAGVACEGGNVLGLHSSRVEVFGDREACLLRESDIVGGIGAGGSLCCTSVTSCTFCASITFEGRTGCNECYRCGVR